MAVDQVIEIARSGLLDRQWYYDTYRDVAIAGVDPLLHYASTGWREGRNPSPLFITDYYLEQVPEIRDGDLNPLVHYVSIGWQQGLKPSPGYRPADGSALIEGVCPLVQDALLDRAGEAALDTAQERSWPAVPNKQASPATEPPGARAFRSVAFYLPQFHEIPENNEAWGKGFTEWTNVRRARPRYDGHPQPEVPGDLGYYELPGPLSSPQAHLTLRRQIALARIHGIDAFCAYVYWFGGKVMLDAPLRQWLTDPTLNFPICLCWANENWTRTWDGKDADVLVSQRHSPEDDINFIEHYAPFLRDSRYLRVGGKPLLVVYRPDLLPDPAATAERWRAWCRDEGIGEIVLASTLSFDKTNPLTIGFDYAIEFPPNSANPLDITAQVDADEGFAGRILDGRELSQRSHHLPVPAYPTWRGATPSWDNEPRRPGKGMSLYGTTPETFQRWLQNIGQDSVDRISNPAHRLVFINAWNEWAEGAHLEPDKRVGYGWLHAVRDAQETVAGVADGTGPGVVVVTHDLQRHGAQLGALALVNELRAVGRRVHTVALGGGPLHRNFEQVCPVDLIETREAEVAVELAADLASRGFTTALCNSSASGWIVPYLRHAGVDVTGLIHELPGAIERLGIAASAEAMATHADRVIYPARTVRDRFPFPRPTSAPDTIRPQGLYLAASQHAERDREQVRRRLGIGADSPVILGVGTGSRAKGIDRFLDLAQQLPGLGGATDIQYVWIGELDQSDQALVGMLRRAPGNFRLLGFVQDPAPYYAAASVLVVPSREDSFPSVALEGLASGLPVVAYRDSTGLNSVVRATGGQLVPESEGVAGLAEAVTRALQDNGSMAAVRRAFVSEHFNYRRYLLDLLAATPARVPRISAVLPAGIARDRLSALLDAVLAQDHPIYEVMIPSDLRARLTAVEDGSLSASAGVYGQGTSVRHVETTERLGQAAKGDFVWLVSDCDIPKSWTATELVQQPLQDSVVRASLLLDASSPEQGWPQGRRLWVRPDELRDALGRPQPPVLSGDALLHRTDIPEMFVVGDNNGMLNFLQDSDHTGLMAVLPFLRSG